MKRITFASSATSTQPIIVQFSDSVITEFLFILLWVPAPYAVVRLYIEFFGGIMLKRIFFVLMSFQLCGCAFIGLNPKHADYKITNHINNTCSFKPNSLKTKSELLKWWGEPNKKEVFDNGTKEKFTYYGSWVWSGVTIWLVVIPIPLILPTKSEYCVVYLENQLIKNTEEYNQVESQLYGCAVGYDYTVKGKWEYGCGLPVVY